MQRGSPEPGADLRADGLRFAIVVSRFNDIVTTRLRDAALSTLVERGASRDTIAVHEVPGSFEIPQAARRVAETGAVDAVVCLGCLIRGATPHFEYIASAVAHGLTAAAGETGVPMAFGVLTTNTVQEALERAGEGSSNKGCEAALAAIEMARLFRAIGRT
jgi:6,7-dimethyl-8-ribityllumazine synthase